MSTEAPADRTDLIACACDHSGEFSTTTTIQRTITDGISSYRAIINIVCARCQRPFEFDTKSAAVSFDGTKLWIPIGPCKTSALLPAKLTPEEIVTPRS